MLSPSDAHLVRADPTLPGLAVLLDEDRFAEVLREQWPSAGITGLEARYVRYKPGTSCIIGYQVLVGGQPFAVHAKASKERVPALRFAAAGDEMRPFALTEGRIAVWPYPFDAGVRALVRLGSADLQAGLIRRLWPEAPSSGIGDAVPLAYKPARRCVLAWSSGAHPVATLRLYSDAEFSRARRAARAFADGDVLRVPSRIGSSARRRAVLMRWMRGHHLDACLGDGRSEIDARIERAGAALAELHGQGKAKLPVFGRAAEAASLDAAARAVATTCPTALDAVSLARRLGGQLTALPAKGTATHGDFYASQVLVGDNHAAIIDLDSAACGDLATDIGNFVAHLELDVIGGRLSAATAARHAASLRVGYARVAPPPSERRVGLYAAAGLLRLAPRPFRDRASDWPDVTRTILDRVDALTAEIGSAAVTVSDGLAFVVSAAGDASSATKAFGACVGRAEDAIRVDRVRQVRHKPGRRWLFEYDVQTARGREVWLGKLRAKGCDRTTASLQRLLWSTGFGDDAADGISVPEVVGVVPDLRLWLQRKQRGRSVIDSLTAANPAWLGVRVARALGKLHASRVVSTRTHDIHGEIRILRARLDALAATYPTWQARVHRVLLACERFEHLAVPAPRLVHRDFHGDQILIDGPRVCLVDLDTLAMGDPAVDAGNLIAHLIEMGLRQPARRSACDAMARAFRDEFLDGSSSTAASVDAYVTLSLARLVQISTLFEDRRAWTGRLLDLCERRLNLGPYRWSGVVPEQFTERPGDAVRG